MTTGQEKVDIYLKKFLTQQQITTNFFDYLQDLIKDGLFWVFRSQGVFTPDITSVDILSSSAADTIDFITPLTGMNGELGNILSLDPLEASQVPFENATGVLYHTGLRFQYVPTGTEINVRTGEIKYTFLKERVGEMASPDIVVDDGDETLTITVDAVCETGVSFAGRKCRVWLKTAVDESQYFEELTVQFVGGKNIIETVGALGQQLGSISVDANDYQVFLEGPTIRRNTDLRLDDNVMYTGNVTGDNGNSPSAFDHADVNNLALGFSAVSSLFFAEHSNVDGSHLDISVKTITTKQAQAGVQLDTQVNATDEDSPDVPAAHTLFQSAGGSGIQGVKWRLRDSSGNVLAFIDAHGNAYFQNLAAVTSIFQSDVTITGNQTIEGNTQLGDNIASDTTTFNSILQSLTNLELVLDSNNDGTGHEFNLYNHSAILANKIFSIAEDGIMELFNNIQTDNAGLSIDLDNNDDQTGELFQITKNGSTDILFQLLEAGDIKFFGDQILTDKDTFRIDLDNNNDGTAELFEITKNGNTATLFQVLAAGTRKLFGDAFTDLPSLGWDIDNDNDDLAATEMFQWSANNGANILMQLLGDTTLRLFGNMDTRNAGLNIDLDADNDQTGELFQITKDGALVTLFKVDENGDATATRDQLTNTQTAYANAEGTAVVTNSSLNEVYDRTLFRNILEPVVGNPNDKTVTIRPGRVTAADGSDFVLPLGAAVANFPGSLINFATGVVAVGTNFTPHTFATPDLWFKYSVNLLQDNTLLVIPASGEGASKSAAPDAPLVSGAVAVVMVAVQNDSATSTTAINNLSEANLDRLPAAGGGGGGTGSTQVEWLGLPGSAPLVDFEDGMRVAKFEKGKANKLVAYITIPEGHSNTTQIKMNVSLFSPSIINTILMKATTYLIRKDTDALNSIANFHDSGNSAITNSATTKAYRQVELELTDSNGDINGIDANPGDVLRVELDRGVDTDTDKIRFLLLSSATGVSF